MLLDAATDFSGIGGQIRDTVETLVKQAGRYVKTRNLEVPLDDLKRFAEPKQMAYVRAKLADFDAFLSEFRGALAELMVAEVLRAEGFGIIARRRQLKSIGGKEADIVATSKGEPEKVILIECKASLPNPALDFSTGPPLVSPQEDRDLSDALSFTQAVRRVRGSEAGLARELQQSTVHEARAVVAVVGEVGSVAKSLLAGEDAEVWDWPNLRERVRAAGLPSSVWHPLEEFATKLDMARRLRDMGKEVLSDLDTALNR